MNRGIKMKYVKKIFLIGAAGLTFFVFSACDDSSSAGGDETETSALSCSAEMSSSSRHCEDCKDEAISSSGKSNDPAEVTDDSSDSKGKPSSAGTSTKSSASKEPDSSGSEGVEGSSASVPGGSSDSSVYDSSSNTLTDLRDGLTYKTVKIGNQTWMAQNLNYAPDENHVHSLGDYAWSGCYGGKADSCAKYGRLYTWEVAMDKAGCGYGESCNNSYEGSQGICPAGWHLPSYNEWETLFRNVGGENVAGRKLKSEEGWNYYSESTKGIDYYGFSALPAGRRDDNGDFSSAGDRALFWSSSEHNISYTYDMVLYHKYLGAYLYDGSKYDAFSVRCVKDSD
ncbi:MAG: fibrobacter succinogenes major paralogous domain-containing protein [Fibrobacter sp.]|nr:fibrobacter succinogenes major paralogous domain-containing protein [Fibrobacter sp.]